MCEDGVRLERGKETEFNPMWLHLQVSYIQDSICLWFIVRKTQDNHLSETRLAFTKRTSSSFEAVARQHFPTGLQLGVARDWHLATGTWLDDICHTQVCPPPKLPGMFFYVLCPSIGWMQIITILKATCWIKPQNGKSLGPWITAWRRITDSSATSALDFEVNDKLPSTLSSNYSSWSRLPLQLALL